MPFDSEWKGLFVVRWEYLQGRCTSTDEAYQAPTSSSTSVSGQTGSKDLTPKKTLTDCPLELIRMIFESLANDVEPQGVPFSNLTDMLCLALVSANFWTVGEFFIGRLLVQAQAPWAGKQILCNLRKSHKILPPHLELSPDLQDARQHEVQQRASVLDWVEHSEALPFEFRSCKWPYRELLIDNLLEQFMKRLQGFDKPLDVQKHYLRSVRRYGANDLSYVHYRCGFQPSIKKLAGELKRWVFGNLFADTADSEDAYHGEDGGEMIIQYRCTPRRDTEGGGEEYPHLGKAEIEAYRDVRKRFHDVFVLRNHTKELYVRGSELPGYLTLGRVLLCFAGWTDKAPDENYKYGEQQLHRGPWAGDRFDVCEMWRVDLWSEQDGEMCEWKDVSSDVVKKIKALGDWTWWRYPRRKW